MEGKEDNTLIRSTNRRFASTKDYKGICNRCSQPVEYSGELLLVEIEETDTAYCCVPIDTLSCPHCGVLVEVMAIFKSLDVTAEFAEVKHAVS